MYGLIHKLKKKKRKLKTIFKSNNHKKTKQKISILILVLPCTLVFLLRNVLVVIHRNQLLSSGVWYWPFPYFDINNNSGKKRDCSVLFVTLNSLLATPGVHTVLLSSLLYFIFL